MDENTESLHQARRNLREAERTLRSIETNLRKTEEELAGIRDWVGDATAELEAATAAGDPVARAHALQSLANAADSRRNFERIAAEFSQLQQRALRTADGARQVIRDVSTIPTSAESPGPRHPIDPAFEPKPCPVALARDPVSRLIGETA
jgi:chromosome segregation ATPase